MLDLIGVVGEWLRRHMSIVPLCEDVIVRTVTPEDSVHAEKTTIDQREFLLFEAPNSHHHHPLSLKMT